MYCTGVWSYVVGAVTTPAFIIIPLVTIWGGVFPIVVSWWAALGLSVYMAAQFCVMNYVHRFRDLKALWFANIANAILWWTFVKACWRALGGAFGRSITFKTTLKGADALRAKSVGDLWMPTASFVSLASALGFGLYKAATGPAVVSTHGVDAITLTGANLGPLGPTDMAAQYASAGIWANASATAGAVYAATGCAVSSATASASSAAPTAASCTSVASATASPTSD